VSDRAENEDVRSGLVRLAEKLERLTEELRASHLELIKVTTRTTGEVREHDRVIERVCKDIEELQRELRNVRQDLNAWETRGSKWGEQLDKSIEDLQQRSSSNFGRNTAYITTAVSVVVTIAVTFFHFFSVK
jgi:hypothetical protein